MVRPGPMGQPNRPGGGVIGGLGGNGKAQVGPSRRRRHPPPGGSHEQALTDQERLVHVLDGLGGLRHADGQSRQPHRSAAEALAQRTQKRPVDLVEPSLVNTEQLESFSGRGLVHLAPPLTSA